MADNADAADTTQLVEQSPCLADTSDLDVDVVDDVEGVAEDIEPSELAATTNRDLRRHAIWFYSHLWNFQVDIIRAAFEAPPSGQVGAAGQPFWCSDDSGERCQTWPECACDVEMTHRSLQNAAFRGIRHVTGPASEGSGLSH